MQLQAFLVDRFEPEEHVLHAELAPVAETSGLRHRTSARVSR